MRGHIPIMTVSFLRLPTFPTPALPAAALAVALSGCALLPGAGSLDGGAAGGPGARRTAWLAYMAGLDLRSRCENGGVDGFRLVFSGENRTDIAVVEVTATVAGGAQVTTRRIGPEEMVGAAPPAPGAGDGDRSALSPAEMAAVVWWMDRMGLFSPLEPPALAPAQPLTWLISGCMAGEWFANASSPGAPAGGVEIRAAPKGPSGLSGPGESRGRAG